MRNYIIPLIILVIIFTLNSCGLFVEKINFKEEELKFFNVYNINDTLIFQNLESHKKELDSS